jgi:hypothetical protein
VPKTKNPPANTGEEKEADFNGNVHPTADGGPTKSGCKEAVRPGPPRYVSQVGPHPSIKNAVAAATSMIYLIGVFTARI